MFAITNCAFSTVIETQVEIKALQYYYEKQTELTLAVKYLAWCCDLMPTDTLFTKFLIKSFVQLEKQAISRTAT